MPNKILLDIKDLDVYYGGIHALHRINMVVEQGEIVSIIGANGAGKSTMLKIFAGLQYHNICHKTGQYLIGRKK